MRPSLRSTSDLAYIAASFGLVSCIVLAARHHKPTYRLSELTAEAFQIGSGLYPPVLPTPLKLGIIQLNFANAETVKEWLTGKEGQRVDVTNGLDVISNSNPIDVSRQIAPEASAHEADVTNPVPKRFAYGASVICSVFGERRDGPSRTNQDIRQRRGLLPACIGPDDVTALADSKSIMIQYPDNAEGEAAFRALQTRIRLLDVKSKLIQICCVFQNLATDDIDRSGIDWQSK